MSSARPLSDLSPLVIGGEARMALIAMNEKNLVELRARKNTRRSADATPCRSPGCIARSKPGRRFLV
jgi:hypothetical protein